jgi:hypothetical protein
MTQFQWKDLPHLTCPADRHWVVFHIPWNPNEWRLGLVGRFLKQCNLPTLLPDEIAVETQQGTNMTLSRELPFRCLRKALSIAISRHGMNDGSYPNVGRVNLTRYFHYDIHGKHPFTNLANVLTTLVWLDGNPQTILTHK